jgi:hypothetical protein
MLFVALLLIGHFILDAAGPGDTQQAGAHLHGGFPLPMGFPLILIVSTVLSITARRVWTLDWKASPTAPPPRI